MVSLILRNEESTQTSTADDSQINHPEYGDEVTPPAYAASSYMRSLREGDPNDKVDVPMIRSTHKFSLGDDLPFGSAMETGKRSVVSRNMTRDCYIKHYAKDEEGNYVGMEKPTSNWQLFFVPNKNILKDVLKQLNEFVDVMHDIRQPHNREELKHITNRRRVPNSDRVLRKELACLFQRYPNDLDYAVISTQFEVI